MAAVAAAWPGVSEKQSGGRLFPSLGTVSGSADMASARCDDDIGAARIRRRIQEEVGSRRDANTQKVVGVGVEAIDSRPQGPYVIGLG